MIVQMRANLLFCLGNEAETPFVAQQAAGSADRIGSCVPQRTQSTRLITQFVNALLTPGEVVELFIGRMLHLTFNVFVPSHGCMSLIQGLSRDFARMIDPHQAGSMGFLLRIELSVNDVLGWGSGEAFDFGMDMKAVAPYLGSLVNQDHQEQRGQENETFEVRKKWLVRNRELIGPDKHYVSGIAARMAASPALVREGIKVALESPANINGLVLKHYDGASFSLMRAFKQGMIDAGVEGLIPCIGKEIEEMVLDNYSPFEEELVEERTIELREEIVERKRAEDSGSKPDGNNETYEAQGTSSADTDDFIQRV